MWMVKRCYFYSHFSDHPFCKGIYSNRLLYYSDWLRSGWAQPPALMRSFSCDSLLQIKVLAQNALKQLKTIPLCSTQSRSFCLKKKKILYLALTTWKCFWELVLWASWNYSGTPVPKTGLTLISLVNGCSEEVFSNLTTLLPPYHRETGRLSQTAFAKP